MPTRNLAVLVILLVMLATPARANFSLGQNLFAAGDYTGALEAWRPLAEAGDTRAQYSLGVIYEKGLGVGKDIAKAAEWYRKAADQGYAPAITALRAAKRRLGPPPSAKPSPRPKPKVATPPRPKAMSERDHIELLVREMLRQADLHLRAGVLEHGDVDVADEGGGYRAEIESLSFTDGRGSRIDIGDVVLHFARQGDRYYRITPRIPKSLKFYEQGGSPPSQIRIGSQRGEFVWDRDLEIMVDMDMTYGDMRIVDEKGREKARFGEMSMTSDLVEKGGRWSGPMALRIRDVEASEKNAGSFRLGELAFVVRVENLDMVRYARLSRGLASGETTPDRLLQGFGQLLSGFSVAFSFDDLVAGPTGQPPARLQRLEYGLSLSGIDRPLASLAMRYGHRGLAGQAPVVPLQVPREAGLALTLDRLPIETVVKAGVAALLEYWFFGEVASGSAVYNELRAALTEARTELRIEDGALAAPDYLIGLAGNFAADAQAILGISGQARLTVAGLNGILAQFRAGRPAPKRPEMSLENVLRQMGRRSADGQTYAYDISVDRQGKFLINGQSAAPLMAAMFAN